MEKLNVYKKVKKTLGTALVGRRNRPRPRKATCARGGKRREVTYAPSIK
jgi:hypothetical protein